MIISIHRNSAIKLYGIPLIILLFLSLASCSDPGEKLKPEGIWLTDGQEYETDIGVLKGTFLLQNGSQKNIQQNGDKFKMDVLYGAVYMTDKTAVEIKKDLSVMQTDQKLDVEVTLIQEEGSGKWLATNGWLCMKGDNLFLLENTRVKVIGGEEKPIFINGKPFLNTDFVAKK